MPRTPFLTGDDVEKKRAEILRYFHETFSIYEDLFSCLVDDAAFFQRPNRLRHPLIFYYGHTAVFFINKLNISKLVAGPVDAELEKMLAVGVDEMSWDDLDQSHYNWPTVAQIVVYRDKVRALVADFISTCKITLPITQTDPLWIILMGIEHERIHLETSSVLIRELQLKHTTKQPAWQRCLQSGSAPQNSLLPVAGAMVRLGKPLDDPLYGWDNEYGEQITEVSAFAASKYLVSNAEFLEFIEDGGYQTRAYWSQEGWDWRQQGDISHPRFWLTRQQGYGYRSMLEEMDMPWNWPVDINCLEAEAFCQWKSAKTGSHIRMPSEVEWSLLRQRVSTDQPLWQHAPGNLNLEHFASSCPVDLFAFADGFFDLIGNVWQWTKTPFAGFEGFAPHPAYDDFSTPTFDGRHTVFKGGCWASTGNYAIRDSRYAFRKHFFQHAGLRYVQSAD